MKHRTIIIIIIAAIILVGGLTAILYPTLFNDKKDASPVEACVILKDRASLFVYVESGTEWDGVWSINKANTRFISHDDTIAVADDLQPGMMIQFLTYDEVFDLIFPTPLRNVEYIETWGEYNYSLYSAGLSIYDGTID